MKDPSDPVGLNSEDANAVDALLAGHQNIESDPSLTNQTPRVVKAKQVLGLLDAYDVAPPPPDLFQSTLARVGEAKQRRQFAQQIQTLSVPASSFGWREAMAVAASLLVMATLMIPILHANQADAQRVACAANLQAAGVGLRSYAADFGTLPRGKVRPGSTWYEVGQSPDEDGFVRSNSQHLYLLIRNRYLSPATLSCAANVHTPRHVDPGATDWASHAAVPFSYQNQFAIQIPKFGQLPNIMALLADKNPLFVIQKGQPFRLRVNIGTESPSAVHGSGQNILSVDGAVRWSIRPQTVEGDNIWTIKGVRIFAGDEAPTQIGDSHLIP
ncbi:MAG: hypothetical protein CMJ20_10310 [Phycisphaeraceae bacterium]|nr:hypothetical protein [Phycisphaeraceae bacterium]